MESSNVVGYTTVQVPADTWYMAGVQFTDVGTGTRISLQDFLKGDFEAKLFWEDEAPIAPFVQILGSDGYEPYYYFADAADGEEEITAWADINGDATDLTLTPGQALWFKNPTAACSVTFAGQVLEAGTKSIACAAGTWNMIANPYPEVLELNSSKISWQVSPKLFWEDEAPIAPLIQVLGSEGYEPYYYFADAADGENEVTAWADINGDKANVAIPVGGAVWFKASDASAVEFVK